MLYNGKIIGFIGLYNYGQVYEAGSLYVHKDFRSLGIASLLQKELFKKNNNLAIFLVTNIEKVRKISDNSNLAALKISEISSKVLKIIESGGKLLNDDSLYMNKALSTNELFIKLNNHK